MQNLTSTEHDPLPEYTFGQIDLADLVALDGLTYFEKILSRELPHPIFSSQIPMYLKAASKGYVLWVAHPPKGLINPMGGVHGGYAMAALDTCLGCAVHTTLPAGRMYTTLEVKVNMTRAIDTDACGLLAEGKLIQSGRRIATSEAKIFDDTGRIYAFGTSTCLIMDAQTGQ